MLQRLRSDQKGVSVVTFALIIPVFVVVIFGTLEMFKVMSVRQSLNLGTYKAARALSAQGRRWLPASAGTWVATATEHATYFIDREVKSNALLPPGYTLRVQVFIEPGAPSNLSQLGWFFTVRSELSVPGLITLPVLNIATIRLADEQASYIEGISGSWVPPEEGAPY
jgi:hypothetical protein